MEIKKSQLNHEIMIEIGDFRKITVISKSRTPFEKWRTPRDLSPFRQPQALLAASKLSRQIR